MLRGGHAYISQSYVKVLPFVGMSLGIKGRDGKRTGYQYFSSTLPSVSFKSFASESMEDTRVVCRRMCRREEVVAGGEGGVGSEVIAARLGRYMLGEWLCIWSECQVCRKHFFACVGWTCSFVLVPRVLFAVMWFVFMYTRKKRTFAVSTCLWRIQVKRRGVVLVNIPGFVS